ncbi:UvrD/REP helicase [Pseudonocardia dioxanivorans CB1190]|uniref:DNA 3'-5' helicase n=1 Tax=Pseudonocardia dioxanivorans (strain ATCC 55486 / DSM 44775 / JCM 13855 / CB1190) TaxID=675635 RepID=F4CQU8_PSEUX|nr:ATP-dependent DNA helicase [Pseudonocardia dioxanivorans]AEA23348.1 UvrD/REP helicase [Pseudonocardia dioxanivorans CB1190]
MSLSPASLAAALGLPPPTEEQAAVIAAPSRPALVVAGAGAGKTETMAARVVWLVATGQVLPEQVLGLTFTRKAAQQLGQRVRSRLRRLAGSPLLDELDPTGVRRASVLAGEPTVSTYHAYAGRLVAEHALRLPAEPAARLLTQTASWQLAHRVVSTWADDLEIDRVPATVTGYLLALAGEIGEHLADPAAVRRLAHEMADALENAPRAKGQRAEPSQTYKRWITAQRMRAELLPLVEAFAARKRAERTIDFADQMAIAARVAHEHPEVGATERATYRAVLLDEYQDTGHAQRVLLRALFGRIPGTPARDDDLSVTAVGDPCQSIYGWRGASAGNLARFRGDFPSGDAPADEYGLLTSFRNPPEVLALANTVSEPLRTAPGAVAVGELRAGPTAAVGDVRAALLPDVDAEIAWMADAVAAQWRSADAEGRPAPTSAVLVRRRADMDPVAAALRARGLPVEVVGLGGLLDTPEVRDLVSALRLVADPLAGPAAMRLLTGARFRLGVADLAALWARARELVPPMPGRGPGPLGPAELALGALPGEQAEQAGIVDALDDPGPPEQYSPAGFDRIRRLGRDLMWLRARTSAPLTDLVADAERLLLLDTETAARPGPVGRAHLDAFADVVAEFSAGAEVASLTALLDYLETAEQAEDGLAPGEIEVTPDRVQVLTVHAAKGLEWEIVAVPHLVAQVFPGRKIGGDWLTSPAELPVPLRGDAADLPAFDLPAGADRKECEAAVTAHQRALDDRRLVEERRLFYVALTRAERVLLLSGHRWGAVGDKPREPSEFLVEVARAMPAAGGRVEIWADEIGEGASNPVADRQVTAQWPADPLGGRSADVHAGAELVRSALRELARRRADTLAAAAAPGAQLDLLVLGSDAADVPVRDGRGWSGGAAAGTGPAGSASDDEASGGIASAATAPGGEVSGGAASGAAASGTAQAGAAQAGGEQAGGRGRGGASDSATDPGAPDPEAAGRSRAQPQSGSRPDAPHAPDAPVLDPDDPEGWAADVDVLLAERAAAAQRPVVELPAHFSVSQLVELAADPDALAARLRRPLPLPPNPHARRGTAFHAWLEQRFGAAGLLDLDELPGAADDGAAPDDVLEELQDAFLASEWADRRPVEVEVPFETVIAGIAVRGRMDAVFQDPDGGWTVVDWKTGPPPDESRLGALAVQLAAYRLAWAALQGVDPSRVRAAFHYVRSRRTLRPADLLDADGLRALLDGVPVRA